MSATTTIRIPDELKARLTRLAEREGVSPHGLILEAIAEKAEALERRQAFFAEAEERHARMLETGMGIAWDDMRRYLDARMAGEMPPPPEPEPIRE